MSFWESVNTELKKAAGTGWSAVRDSAKIGKIRYKKHNLHKDAGKLFAELGGVVYDMAKPPYDENPLSRSEVLKLIEDIKKVEDESSALEDEIVETKKKEPEEQEKASQTAGKSEEDKGGGEE